MPTVSEDFYNALQSTLIRFRDAKQNKDGTLHEVYQLEIDIMRAAIGNKKQSNRQLRDNVQKARKQINNWWRNYFISSLLCDYVKEVLKEYPLDVLYEKQYFNQEEANIKLDARNKLLTREIETIKQAENAEYVDQLFHQLEKERSLRQQLDSTLKTSQAYVDELRHQVESLQKQAADRDNAYAELRKRHEELSKRHFASSTKASGSPARSSSIPKLSPTPGKSSVVSHEMDVLDIVRSPFMMS